MEFIKYSFTVKFTRKSCNCYRMDRSSSLDTPLMLIMPLINQQNNGIKAAGMDIAVLVSNAMPGSV